MRRERPDVQYEKIAMDWVMEYDPERYNVLMRRLVSQIEKGWWKEVPLTCDAEANKRSTRQEM